MRLIAALMEASRFCDVRENRPELARMLAQRQYIDVDRRLLTNSLVGPFDSGRGRRTLNDFIIYDSVKAGVPSRARGKWVYDLVRASGLNASNTALRSETIPRIFREDIFEKASALTDLRPSPDSSPPFLNGARRNKPPSSALAVPAAHVMSL